MRVILPKIRGETPAIGSTSHRRMQGTKRRLEHLMRHSGFQSVRNNYETSEVILSRVESRETNGFHSPKLKPHFSSQIGGKNRNFEGLLWGQRAQKYMLGLGLGRRGSMVQGQINSREDIRL